MKPFPAVPNDTDVLIFGKKGDYLHTIEELEKRDYQFHEWAPMQTTLYDPRGRARSVKAKRVGSITSISIRYFNGLCMLSGQKASGTLCKDDDGG
jgi:AAA+ superfamily predicted ATPase